MKGVFDTKPQSGYDDEIARHYHFPSQYRAIVQQLAGDWIVYREPRRNEGRQAYIAVARVLRVDPDPKRPGYFYALMADYRPFDLPVPFSSDGKYAEGPLRSLGDPSKVGASLRGKSVRVLSDDDFAAIVRAGLRETLDPDNAVRLELDEEHADFETLSLVRAPVEEQERRIEQILVNRKIREASFRQQVRRLRKPMRRNRTSYRQRLGQSRSSGCSHLACGRRWSRRRPERDRSFRHRTLAVRPSSDIADGRLSPSDFAQ